MVLKRCPSVDEPRLHISLAGDLDLIVGENKGKLFYFENKGSARRPEFDQAGDTSLFSGAIATGSPDDELDYMPVLADLDGDSDLDIVVGELGGRISYYENIGDATAPQFVFRTGDADPFDGIKFGEGINPALADIDLDGDLDLAIGDKPGSIKYYENLGSALLPQFMARVGSSNPFDKIKSDENVAPRFVDLDGDNDLDLVVGEATKGLTFYENRQQGTTYDDEPPKFIEFAGTASPLGFVEVDIRGSGESFSAPTLVDIDGDGDLDVVVGHNMGYDTDGNDELSADERRVLVSTDTLFFYENVGSAEAPEFVQRTGSENPFAFVDAWGYSSATLGDLDADGDLDLVLGDDQGELHYYENVKPMATPFVARQAWANPLKMQFDDVSSCVEIKFTARSS